MPRRSVFPMALSALLLWATSGRAVLAPGYAVLRTGSCLRLHGNGGQQTYRFTYNARSF